MIKYLLDRLKEPSTQAQLSTTSFAIASNTTGILSNISYIVFGLTGLLAYLLKEGQTNG